MEASVVVPGLWLPRPDLWTPGRIPWRKLWEREHAEVVAAVALDQPLGTAAQSGVATTTLTTTATVTAGAHIILVAGRYNFTPSVTMSCSGGGLTWVEDVTLASGNIRISVFRAHAPAGLASGTVLTITHSSGSASDCLIGATSFTGIATSGTVTTSGSGSGATAAWATASIGANAGDALIGGAFCDGLVGTSAPTAPAVEAFDFNSAGQSETETGIYKIGVAGADTLAGTWSGAVSWVSAAVAYAPAISTEWARPDADVTDGAWLNEAGSAVNLYASLDETVVDENDYIQSSASPGSADVAEVGLSNITP